MAGNKSKRVTLKGSLCELGKHYSESVALDLGVLEGRISEDTDGQRGKKREEKKKDESGFA